MATIIVLYTMSFMQSLFFLEATLVEGCGCSVYFAIITAEVGWPGGQDTSKLAKSSLRMLSNIVYETFTLSGLLI